jgi:hypothetical protein
MPDRPQKITFVEMRGSGFRGLLVYRADYKCSHSNRAQRRPLAGSTIGYRVAVCLPGRGKRGADARPDFNWDKTATAMMGYRPGMG